MSLRWRLGIVLIAFLIALGLSIAWVGRYSSNLYFQEINQSLNASVAMYVVDRLTLIEDGTVNEQALKALAEQAMTVNPSVEVYLLDVTGQIVAHALPGEAVVRDRVAMGPIQSFINGASHSPVLGTDPRSSSADKAFSAAPIMYGEQLQGYLYVVLGGQLFDQVQSQFLGSFIGRLAAAVLLVVLVIGGFIGYYVFGRLTRPLEKLEAAVSRYTGSGFTDASGLDSIPESVREVTNLKTELHQLTGQLALQFEQAETNDRLRRELLANISHDLRTPLSAMQGYIETLLIKDANLNTLERRQYLGTAHQHTKQLNRMVADLFELARLDSGALQPNLEKFPLSELLQDVIQEFSLEASERQIELRVNAYPNIEVLGDISLIQRVLENLISNALRYTSAGGLVEISLQERTAGVGIEVSDSGCGIDPDVIPVIFDRYARGAEKADSDHSGLGLAIVKRILEVHGSEINVTSKVNVGTSFSFELGYEANGQARAVG